MTHDTPEAIAITDKAARDLLQHEKALQVKHTPAPWLIDGGTVYALEHYGWKKGVEQFCNRFTASISRGQSNAHGELEANARLIAAAPEILEALKQAMVWIDNWEPEFTNDPDWPEDRDKARSAIAKATGENHE